MSNKDLLQRFIFEHAPVRGEYVFLHDSYQTIIHQHRYPPPIQKILGEALCVAGLLSAIIKFKGRLTVQFRGKGKLKLLLAQCTDKFELRGLVKWDGHLSYEQLLEAFTDGTLAIMLDSGANQNRYQGVVAWQENLTQSIEAYFKQSEQLATRLWLKVDDLSAAGFLLQVVPEDEKEALIDESLADSEWPRITTAAEEIKNLDILNIDYVEMLKNMYPEDEIRVFPATPLQFGCTCTRQRGEDAIFIIGLKEAEEELKNNHSMVVTCDFCSKEYVFDRKEVQQIFTDRDNPTKGDPIH